MSGSWREAAAPIITATLQATLDKPEKEIRQALIDAYPFGPRELHPYKIWCDEIRRQRGLKRVKGVRPTVDQIARLAELKAEAAKGAT